MVQRNPILLAMDVPTAAEAEQLARELAGSVGGFKIGKELFVAEGPAVVRTIQALGGNVFLDLKFHDIPNTVAKAVASAVRLGVQMLTVHAGGGGEMMAAAARAARETAEQCKVPAPLVLGVTVLTSSTRQTLEETGVEGEVEAQVIQLAKLAAQSGLGGLVCSPREITALRRVLPPEMKLVTPGIRSGAEKADDQKRTLSAAEAMAAGADWLVIGRPIHGATNPRLAAEGILASIR